jgi:hypothetical protein
LTRSYRFISVHRAVFDVTRLRRVLGVRHPGFYGWLAAAPARGAVSQGFTNSDAILHADRGSPIHLWDVPVCRRLYSRDVGTCRRLSSVGVPEVLTEHAINRSFVPGWVW